MCIDNNNDTIEEAKQTVIKLFKKKLKCFYTNLEMTSNNNI